MKEYKQFYCRPKYLADYLNDYAKDNWTLVNVKDTYGDQFLNPNEMYYTVLLEREKNEVSK